MYNKQMGIVGPLSSLPQHIAAQVAATRSHQLDLMQQWQQQQQASQVYLQVLQQVLTSLIELIQDHMLGQQQVQGHQLRDTITCGFSAAAEPEHVPVLKRQSCLSRGFMSSVQPVTLMLLTGMQQLHAFRTASQYILLTSAYISCFI